MPANSQEIPASGEHSSLPQHTGRHRIAWDAVPHDVAAGIERQLGAEVTEAVGQPGGFSEGFASMLTLADGRRVFVKAASSEHAPAVADFHRREIAITRQLDTPWTPRLLDAYDDGTWVAGVYEEIQGRLPTQPWRPDELDRALATLVELTDALTPPPVDHALLREPRLGGWQALAAGGGEPVERLRTMDPWAVDHLEDIANLETQAPHALAGDTLQHGDLYPFNIMLNDERVFVVDWPHAWIGAPHCDAVTLLSSASLSGVDPQKLAERHPLTRAADKEQIDVTLAAHAGFLLRIATSVGPEADQNLVAMMTALGLASVR
ncbi:aminoglycoside phosphotransferase family protein [Streptomyces sp. NPDC093064]|uniref:aminoglycoside phosphotransferase family protein n=1 Tax=Streptomyces sp. NPDC093064 TaxID=3366020 RepID=UPI00382283BD